MKQKIILLLLILTIISCNHRENRDIWISTNKRVIDKEKGWVESTEGMIIDFKNSEFYHLSGNTPFNFEYDLEKIIVKVDTSEIEFRSKMHKPDSLVVQLSDNMDTFFEPLSLESKIDFTKNQVTDYFTTNDFDKIKDSLKINFLTKYYPSQEENRMVIKSTYLDEFEYEGFWLIKEIDQNFFLLISFNPEFTTGMNIYQITSMNNSRLRLTPIYDDGNKFKITELTCL